MKKRYIVGFYDAFDGWCHMSAFYGWEYDTLEDAKKKASDLMIKLDVSNKNCGEHYGVIDTKIGREVYCNKEDRL